MRSDLTAAQACGSGGTSAGIALGNHLSGYGACVWAYGVCDDPDYFYDHIDGLFKDLGVPQGMPPCAARTYWVAKTAQSIANLFTYLRVRLFSGASD